MKPVTPAGLPVPSTNQSTDSPEPSKLTMDDLAEMLKTTPEQDAENARLFRERLQDTFYPIEDLISLDPEYGDDYSHHRLTPEYRAWRDRHFTEK